MPDLDVAKVLLKSSPEFSLANCASLNEAIESLSNEN